jgi:HPt (histidine-containing phosphotransfer) domain-containing protein
MAKNVNIKLGANITDFESKMKRAQRGFKKTAAKLKSIGKSMSLSLTAPLTAFAAASVKAFDTQAKAEAQLRTALQGNETAFNNLKDAAEEFQKISLFGDEEIIAQQAYLASLGLTESKINDVIRASMDLAAGTGQTLEFGVKNLAKTFSGLTGELGESIPALKELTTEQLRAGEAVNVVADAFSGQAEAAAEAGLGGLQQLKNSFSDITEEIGRGLMPHLNKLKDKLQEVVTAMQSLTSEQLAAKIEMGLYIAAIAPAIIVISQIIQALEGLSKAFLFISATAIPAVIGALETLYLLMLYNPITAIALAVTALGASLYLLIDNLSDATDEQVKFNAAQEEAIVLTKEQAEAIDGIMAPFLSSIGTATTRVKELKTALKEVAQISSVDNDNGVGGQLIRVKYELDDTEESMSAFGMTALNTFSMIADRVLQFRGTFVNVLEEIGIMLGKMILKAAIMAAVLSLLSGGVGGAGILGVGNGLSFGEAFGQTLTGRASGGSVVAGQPYIVGESGAEMFMPGQSGTIIPNNNLGGGSSIPDVRISGEDLIIVFDRAKRHRNALG